MSIVVIKSLFLGKKHSSPPAPKRKTEFHFDLKEEETFLWLTNEIASELYFFQVMMILVSYNDT